MMIVLFPSRCFGFRLLYYLLLRKPVWAQIALQLGLALLSTSFPKNQKLFLKYVFIEEKNENTSLYLRKNNFTYKLLNSIYICLTLRNFISMNLNQLLPFLIMLFEPLVIAWLLPVMSFVFALTLLSFCYVFLFLVQKTLSSVCYLHLISVFLFLYLILKL